MARSTAIPADELLAGVVLITVPHMDDAVLACGGTVAQLPDKGAVHVVYATDGTLSPEPVLRGRDRVDVDLFAIRKAEAREAMDRLGVPAQNIHFLGLPDRRLRRRADALRRGLEGLAASIRPDCVLTPFRFDQHPDHLAVNRAAVSVFCASAEPEVRLVEYFVYHRYRLLPGGDVRDYLRPGLLRRVDIDRVAELKRTSLDRFRSQTTVYFDWQTRPNLTAELLDELCRSPECFLSYHPAMAGTRIFSRGGAWIRVAHRLEPFLKRHKDRAVAIARRTIGAQR